MEGQRPGSPQSLTRRARDHPDRAIAAKIDERKRRGDFDLCVAPNVELALIHGIIADSAVATIAQHHNLIRARARSRQLAALAETRVRMD